MSKFIHFSKGPIGSFKPARQGFDPNGDRTDKPNGLWFSVGDDDDGWRAWCEAESFSLGSLAHRTEIVLTRSAKLLMIGDADGLDRFTERHGMPWPFGGSIDGYYGRGYGINWKAVADEWDAIAIAPYIGERRLHEKTHWYYSWDCASGCIWSAAAIAELRPFDVERAA